jgi:DNA replication protein DnaC
MPLKNSQYDVIMRNYNQKQFENKHRLDLRTEEVYKKVPEIEQIDKTISSLSVEQAKKLLNGEEDALCDLKEQLSILSAKKLSLLNKNGFPDNYLLLHYTCSDCRDTGYIGNQKCHCFKQAVIDMLYSQSNIKEILSKENFDTFSFEYYDKINVNEATGLTPYENMQRIVSICKQFIKRFSYNFENLLFYGETGVGKTFLSNCIAKELLENACSVIYFTAFQLFDIFAKNTFEHGEDSFEIEDMYHYILDCDLLIIDDLGTELTNSFISSQLFLCLNERFLRKKSTIISTNLSLNMLAETYSERTFSRISSNYTMLKFYGEDIRIKKALMKHP